MYWLDYVLAGACSIAGGHGWAACVPALSFLSPQIQANLPAVPETYWDKLSVSVRVEDMPQQGGNLP